jgi:hypothetical protein
VADPPDVAVVAGRLAAEQYRDAVVAVIGENLRRAKEALEPVPPHRALLEWYSGAALEQTWLTIHRASEALVMIQSPGSVIEEYVQIDAAFRANIQAQDPATRSSPTCWKRSARCS